MTNITEILKNIDSTHKPKFYMHHIRYNEHTEKILREVAVQALQNGKTGINELRQLESELMEVLSTSLTLLNETSHHKKARQSKLHYLKDTEYILDTYIVDYMDTIVTYDELIKDNEDFRNYLIGRLTGTRGFATETIFSEVITYAYSNNMQSHKYMHYIHDISRLIYRFDKERFTLKLQKEATEILDWIDDTFQPILTESSVEFLWSLRVILKFLTEFKNRPNTYESKSNAYPQSEAVIEMVTKLKMVFAISRNRDFAVDTEEIIRGAAQDIEEYKRSDEPEGVNRYAPKKSHRADQPNQQRREHYPVSI